MLIENSITMESFYFTTKNNSFKALWIEPLGSWVDLELNVDYKFQTQEGDCKIEMDEGQINIFVLTGFGYKLFR